MGSCRRYFPCRCALPDKIVFPEYFDNNPDISHSKYQTLYGIYSPGCGLDQVHMSGHDEYLYHVVKNNLPPEASYIIRYHSFYAAHREEAYEYLMNEYDEQMRPWLNFFSSYDLYSKSAELLDIGLLMPYYRELVAEFFPLSLNW